MSVLRRIAAPVSLATLLLVACGDPSFSYVRNTSLRTAFKLPAAWATFDKAEVLGQTAGPAPSTPDPIKWLVGIDGGPDPAASHVLDPDTLNGDYPTGIALVQAFSFNDRDASSYGSLRNYIFPVDQLVQDPNSAQVLSYDDKIDHDGVRGVHIVFQFRANALASAQTSTDATSGGGTDLSRVLLGGSGAALLDKDFVTVDQVVLVDPDTSQVYYFAVMCSATCYQRNHGDIESTVDSWTVIP